MFLTEIEHLDSVLTTGLEKRIPLKITLHGTKETFVSFLLDVNAGAAPPSIVISRLTPDYGNKIIIYTKGVNIEFTLPDTSAETNNLTYSFNALFLGEEDHQGKPALRVSYPEKRKFPRVDPSPATPVTLNMFFKDSEFTEKLVSYIVEREYDALYKQEA